MAARDLAPRCGPDEHCITCGDEGLPMRVVGFSEHDGLAICRSDEGALAQVAVELIGEVGVGDRVLAHAGVALARLGAGPPAEVIGS